MCDEAKEALAHGELTLAQAEALTLGTHEAQRDIVQRLADGYHYDAEDIRDMLLGQRPSAALARFPLEQYQGTYTTDLFGEDATTYFDDVEQFFALQRQAVAAMAEDYAVKAEWVEVTEHYNIPRWHYRQAEDGATGGVVINLAPSGQVEVLEGLDRHAVTTSTASATADTPLAPKPKPAYSEVLCRSMAHHKSMAVQHLLLANPRKAREAVLLLPARRITCRASAYRVTIASTPSRRRARHRCPIRAWSRRRSALPRLWVLSMTKRASAGSGYAAPAGTPRRSMRRSWPSATRISTGCTCC